MFQVGGDRAAEAGRGRTVGAVIAWFWDEVEKFHDRLAVLSRWSSELGDRKPEADIEGWELTQVTVVPFPRTRGKVDEPGHRGVLSLEAVRLHTSSRLSVDGSRPCCAAIDRTPYPPRCSSAMRSRSSWPG